jgi:hypothetical protein
MSGRKRWNALEPKGWQAPGSKFRQRRVCLIVKEDTGLRVLKLPRELIRREAYIEGEQDGACARDSVDQLHEGDAVPGQQRNDVTFPYIDSEQTRRSFLDGRVKLPKAEFLVRGSQGESLRRQARALVKPLRHRGANLGVQAIVSQRPIA